MGRHTRKEGDIVDLGVRLAHDFARSSAPPDDGLNFAGAARDLDLDERIVCVRHGDTHTCTHAHAHANANTKQPADNTCSGKQRGVVTVSVIVVVMVRS